MKTPCVALFLLPPLIVLLSETAGAQLRPQADLSFTRERSASLDARDSDPLALTDRPARQGRHIAPAPASTEQTSQGVTSTGDSARTTDPELLGRVEAWRMAYNGGDLRKLGSFYARESDYISPHVVGLTISGRDAIVENFGKGIRGGGHIDAITVLDAESSGDLAVLVCRYDATNGGVKVSGRNILVMRRIEGRWLITTHASIVRD